MPRHDGVSDEEWDEILEEKARRRAKELTIARIEREGFEMSTYDPEPADVCCNRQQKPSRRVYKYGFCGAKPVVVLSMASPDNPEGIRVPLCRKCLAEHIKSLVGVMEIFA